MAKRTEEDAVNELQEFYREHGPFEPKFLASERSGLVKYISIYYRESVREFCDRHSLSKILKPVNVGRKRTEEEVEEELLNFYKENGSFTKWQLAAKDNRLAYDIEQRYGGLEHFCEQHKLTHILKEQIKERKTRTEEDALEELKEFYEQNGPFTSNMLMASNSGLERYLRTHHEGLRGFCERHGISDILQEPKKIRWNDELVKKTIIEYVKTNQKRISTTDLTSEGLSVDRLH